MSLNVIPHTFANGSQGMLEQLDQLRARIEAGDVAAFAAVTINEGDETHAWIASKQHVTRLRVYGAVSHLQHCLHTGEV